jgi:hypothetical protein
MKFELGIFVWTGERCVGDGYVVFDGVEGT